jgi:DNA repair protein RecO (recombination protein O)
MEVSTHGIVLRKLPYAEGSYIISIYTRRFGQLAFMARGAGRKGSGMSKSAMQSLSRVELQCTYKENRQMQVLKGLRAHPDANMLMESPQKSAVAMFLAEVLYKTLREEAADEDLFDFIDEAISFFAREPFQPDFHLVFLMHLSRYFGFFPSGKFGPESPCFDLKEGSFSGRPADARPILEGSEARHFYTLALTEFGESRENLHYTDRRDLLHNMLRYYELHLEGMGKIKSLEVLSAVFA